MTPVTLGHKLGVETTAMIRARAGISYALTEAMDEGHCGLPTAEPAQLAEEILRGLWSRRRSTSNWLRARSSLTAWAKQTESSLPACTGPSVSSRSGYCGWRTARCHGSGSIPRRHLSCRTFAGNAVRLQLHALAYNLGNFLRTLATPEPIKDWSLTSLKEKLIKINAKGRLPDGRSRHPTANVPGNFADDRRAAAAATTASVIARRLAITVLTRTPSLAIASRATHASWIFGGVFARTSNAASQLKVIAVTG